ncbi:MAG: type II toxin-antitoxin system death-on-curing family toxin [Desulfatitalea sp.]|nr:type II toxin-antitoxin system death-on-curing family toxin [Desulfatitalea sp.]NNJ99615.1 type II toxin-antitoxin system death-on-curing family toxin [Desulfatitalea sp.]
MDPVFLSLSEVLEIHQDQITRYGGAAGIRDIELLKSALGMPPATYGGQFLHTDIYEMTAAYLFHLVKNHPFIDGNKRVGAATALIFLYLNGFDFDAPEDDLADMVLAVARGDLDKADVVVFIRRHTQPA